MIIDEGEVTRASERVVEKTWGREFWVVNEPNYCLKYLKINPGFQCSVHCHKKKDETFVGLSGTVRLMIHTDNGAEFQTHAIHEGQKYHVTPKTYHSFQAFNVAWLMEISTHHDDRDVFRLQESRRLTE